MRRGAGRSHATACDWTYRDGHHRSQRSRWMQKTQILVPDPFMNLFKGLSTMVVAPTDPGDAVNS